MADEARDTIVIGTSAGGVDALPRVIATLPRTFPAAVLIAQHLGDYEDSQLASIIQGQAQIEVRWAAQGDHIDVGRVYVCPPGVHMLVVDSHLQLMATARENFVRPSIDRLFRSAAALRGARTIGVLLTGLLDDGVAGLAAIRDAGGVAIVQDPEDADFPDLPRRALEKLAPDLVLPISKIGPQLQQLAGTPAPRREPPRLVSAEAALDRDDPADPRRMSALGPQTSISCPECGGPTWAVGSKARDRYRCYLGHVATAREIVANTNDQVEAALWTAVRALCERAMTYNSLADDAAADGKAQASELFRTRARAAREQAETARRFMVELATTVQ
ncbi:MAG TPA: chemotaxis protein CheB [Kofleriaceae bacterium]|jgi:two-component system chemotaxis response regulator CheB|nr:chemotaxis protein CheB [Kofleriaceae bacterium]